MTHITTSLYLGLLGASPYVLFELFRFISPALYETEKKVFGTNCIYHLYTIHIWYFDELLCVIPYFRSGFLGTYSVAEKNT